MKVLNRKDSFKSIQLCKMLYHIPPPSTFSRPGGHLTFSLQYCKVCTEGGLQSYSRGLQLVSYNLLAGLTWTAVISWQTRIHSLGLPLSGPIEERHCRVGQHGGVAAGDQPTLGGRASPHSSGVTQSGGVPPQDVARVTVVGRPAPVDVAPAEIGHFNKSIFCRGRVITFHF